MKAEATGDLDGKEAWVHFGKEGEVQELVVDLRGDTQGTLRAFVIGLLTDGRAR